MSWTLCPRCETRIGTENAGVTWTTCPKCYTSVELVGPRAGQIFPADARYWCERAFGAEAEVERLKWLVGVAKANDVKTERKILELRDKLFALAYEAEEIYAVAHAESVTAEDEP